MENKTVNILGMEYEILVQSEKENPKLKDNNGLCEPYSKKLIINDFEECKDDPMIVENFEEFKKKVLRHECFHAFFGEAGMSSYETDETLIDWLAIQSPKIFKALIEVGAIDISDAFKIDASKIVAGEYRSANVGCLCGKENI